MKYKNDNFQGISKIPNEHGNSYAHYTKVQSLKLWETVQTKIDFHLNKAMIIG